MPSSSQRVHVGFQALAPHARLDGGDGGVPEARSARGSATPRSAWRGPRFPMNCHCLKWH
eukprot:364689-Chlamydomonas_euryale.AAC.7